MSEYEELGTQFDGEPVTVEPVVPEPEQPPVTSEPEPEAEAEETPEQVEERKKRKTGSQKAREKAEQLARENETLRRMLLERDQPKAEKPVEHASDAPRLEDFETHADWVNATVQHGIKKALEAERSQSKAQTWQQQWQGKAEAAREKYEDFDEALSFMPPIPQHVAEVLAESEFEADLAYHLANHPDEARKLNSMSPAMAGREIARLEARFNQPKPVAKPVTKAPPPINPVAVSGTVPPKVHHAGFEEF